jgi:predicted nucleic acid-binding protein
MEKIERVFLDSDVMLDYIANRQPFFDIAKRLFKLFFNLNIELVTSSIAIANAHYILSKQDGRIISKRKIDILLNYITVIPSEHSSVKTSFSNNFKDEEDAIQYFTALEYGGVKCICTRNAKDFPKGDIPVLSPIELIARLGN